MKDIKRLRRGFVSVQQILFLVFICHIHCQKTVCHCSSSALWRVGRCCLYGLSPTIRPHGSLQLLTQILQTFYSCQATTVGLFVFETTFYYVLQTIAICMKKKELAPHDYKYAHPTLPRKHNHWPLAFTTVLITPHFLASLAAFVTPWLQLRQVHECRGRKNEEEHSCDAWVREKTVQGHVIPQWAGCQWKSGLFHRALVLMARSR